MNLRPYQDRAIDDLRRAYMRGHRAPCLVLPTGGGKTVIAAAIIRGALAKGLKVLFLAHRAELLDQSVAKLAAAGIHDVRVIRAATDLGSRTARVIVASVPTLTRWQAMPPADLVVFDEAHHVKATTWRRIADNYAAARLLGMTATPQRADGSPLGDVFDALVVGSTVGELTELGHLVPCRAWAPHDVLDAGELALTPVEAYQTHGDGGRAVVFCATVEHAGQVAAEFAAAGIRAAVVEGNSTSRKADLAAFTRGEIRVLCNVHVLTEGWDDPGCSVCILARKPGHVGTFLQMVGRVLRPAPGKREAVLVDLCGASLKHGLPATERTYTLDGQGIARADREAIRQCPTCGAVFEAGPEACPMCGAQLPRSARALPASVGVGVAPVEGRPAKPMRPVFLQSKFPGRCRSCARPIGVGDRIAWSKGEPPTHELCWANEVMCA